MYLRKIRTGRARFTVLVFAAEKVVAVVVFVSIVAGAVDVDDVAAVVPFALLSASVSAAAPEERVGSGMLFKVNNGARLAAIGIISRCLLLPPLKTCVGLGSTTPIPSRCTPPMVETNPSTLIFLLRSNASSKHMIRSVEDGRIVAPTAPIANELLKMRKQAFSLMSQSAL